MKKISLIITSLVFCIAAVFVFPAKEANANPLAVGGALYLGGAGVYVLGAVAVAGIAGLAGCESCQEDIEAHAQRTWDGTTQLAKDGMQLMVDASVGAWGATSSALTQTDANFNTWMDASISDYALGLANAAYGADPFNVSSMVKNAPWSLYPVVNLSRADGNTSLNAFCKGAACTTHNLSVRVSSAGDIHFSIIGTESVAYAAATGFTKNQADAFVNTLTSFAAVSQAWDKLFPTQLGISIYAMQATITSVTSSTREAWEDMRDAGLVLPVDNARPMMGDIPLSYDPVTDAYSGSDGITVPHSDVTGFDYQKPHWKTVDDLIALGGAAAGLGAGLYIDGWAGSDSVTSTYDPATDITTTTTSTGTTTNVTTGETVTTGTTTTTTTGDTTGNPPVDPPPTTSPPKTGEPLNPFKAKPMPVAALTGLFQLLAALIFYLIRLFTFIATLALIAPTPIDNPYFIWFTTATFQGITPYPLVQNLALFFLGFSVYRSVRRVFG